MGLALEIPSVQCTFANLHRRVAIVKTLLEKVLLGFLMADDPVQAMLEWVAYQMMLIEAENKVGADLSYIKREKVQEALERGRAFLPSQAAS